MSKTPEGARKNAARRIGVSIDEYVHRFECGEKWCTNCKAWHLRSAFHRDASRSDGLAASCSTSRSTGRPKGWHEKPNINPLTGRPGPSPRPSADDDKKQARHRVNLEVRMGRRPPANDLPCADCDHIYVPGGMHHEYDHYLGYAAEFHTEVQAVCVTCHHKRETGRITHCIRGHVFSGENTMMTVHGHRVCRPCRRERERAIRTAAWWRERRKRKRGK